MTQFTEPQMRPPQEAHSLLLRATQGCTYNKCSFCYVSRGYPFRVVTDTELSLEAERARPFFPSDTPIYLTGSNPLALPFAGLASWIAVLRTSFPHFSRLSMQARIGDIALKSDEELARLAHLGLSHLYIGTENGNDEVLALMNKGHTSEDIVRELTRLDGAGITYTSFYILGMGGKGRGVESGLATARMFNRVHPKRITTTGLTVFPNTPLQDMVREGSFTEADEREKIEELRAFLGALDVDTFYDGIHYLNPLNFRLRVRDGEARKDVLREIDEILSTMCDEELELMVGRRHMHSL